MHRKLNWLRWTVAVILFVVGLALIFNQQIKSALVDSYRPTVTRQTVVKNQKKKASYDFNSVQDLSLQSVAAARAKKQAINVIGEIAIPDIDMVLPIAKGVDNTTLALAAGTMREDMQMGKGNYALAGHNMANGSKILFSPLYYHAKKGQMIYLTDMKQVYEYRIYQRKFIKATDVQVVNDTKNAIVTLITCDDTGKGRLMIRGKLVRSEKFSQAPQKAQKALSSKYTTGRDQE